MKRKRTRAVDYVWLIFFIVILLLGTYFALLYFGVITGHDVSNAGCIDTDGGLNFGKQGTVSITGGASNADGCPTSTSLYEYYCDNDGQSHYQSYTCLQGCLNGACTGVAPSLGSITLAVAKAGTTNHIPNAQVRLEQGSSSHVLTGSTGSNYHFANIPAGTYLLSVNAPGYALYTESNVLVPADSSRTQDAFLLPSAGGNAYWKFDESSWPQGSASVLDLLGTSNGTPQGSVTTVAQGVGGRAGYFDGADDVVAVNGYAVSTGGPVSVMFWMRVNASEVKDAGVFGLGNGDTNRFNAYLWSDPKKLYWDYGNSLDTEGRISVDYAPYYGNWTHVALVSGGNGGTIKAIYLNGKVVASASASDGPDVALNELTLGMSKDTSGGTVRTNFFKGMLDNINISARVASADEIKSIYERERRTLVSAESLGLIGEWKFEESVSADVAAVRDTFGSSAGTAKGGVINVPGKVGRAFSFDGVDDEIIVPNSILLSPRGPFAVSGWFKAGNLISGDPMVSWVSKRDAFVFGPHKDGSVGFHLYLSADGTTYVWKNVTAPAGSVKEGEWQYWTAVYNGTHLVLFLNGSEVRNITASGVLPASRDLYIGHDFTGGPEKRFFNGAIDELQLYDRALSPSDVDGLFKTQLVLAAATPVIPSDIGACGTIDKAGSYLLTRSLTSSGTCITITSDNVVFDGQGHTIGVAETTADPLAGSSVSTHGIVVRDRVNVTIKNVRVEGFSTGVLLHRAHRAVLDGVSILQSEFRGLHLNETRSAFVTGGSIEHGLTGILFERSNHSVMNRIAIRSQGAHGVFFGSYSMNNNLTRMTFRSNGLANYANDSTSKNNYVSLASDDEDNKVTTPVVIQPTVLATGYMKALSVGENLLFRVNTTTHNLTITSFTAGKITLTISGIQGPITLSTSETKSLDLNGNGRADLNVTFVQVTNNKPVIKLLTISESAVVGGGGTGGGSGGGGSITTNLTNASKLDDKKSAGWDTQTMIIVIVALIIFIIFVIIAIIYAVKHQNTERNNEFYRPEPHSSLLQPSFGG